MRGGIYSPGSAEVNDANKNRFDAIFVAEYCDLRYCYLRAGILHIAISKMKSSGGLEQKVLG